MPHAPASPFCLAPSRHGGLITTVVVAALLVAVIVGAILISRGRRVPTEWVQVVQWDPSITLNATELTRTWGIPGKAVSLPAGAPFSLEPGQWLIITTAHEADDVRVTVDAEWSDRIDAIELAVRADSEPTTAWWMVPRSVNCQFGGYSGVESSLSINSAPGAHGHQSIAVSTFVKQQRHRLTLESHEGFVRTHVDGNRQLELAELTPLGGSNADRVGIRTWAPILIHGITVERVRPGAQVSALRVGDALAAQGALQPALAWYRRLAHDHPGTDLAALAWAKVGACAAINPNPNSDMQEAMERLVKDHPDHPLREQVEALDILHRWRLRDFAGALSAMEALQARRLDTVLPVRMNSERLGAIPSPFGRRFADILLRVPGLTQLNLSNLGLDDIGFLKGRQLNDLNISGNPIEKIDAITGMPLQRLSLIDTLVADLTPVKGMPLRILTLTHSKVTDLTPVAGLRLEELYLSDTGIADLAPVRGQPIVSLSIANTPVASLEPLVGMRLHSLFAASTRIQDLQPLRGMPIQNLDISGCSITSIDPIASPELVNVLMNDCPVADVTPFAKAVHVKVLELSRTGVTSIDALAGLPLERLILNDLPIEQINAVQGMPMQVLSLINTRVASVEPLESSPLRILHAHGSLINSLRPLAHSPMEYIDIGDAPVADLSDVATITTLRYLGVSGDPKRFDRSAAAERLSAMGRSDLAVMVQCAAWATTEPARLRALAQNINGQQRLIIGRHVSWEEAVALAEAADANLVCPRSPNDLHTLLGRVVLNSEVWTGLIHGEGGVCLPDGTAVPDLRPENRYEAGAPIHMYWADGGQGCAWSSTGTGNRKKMVMLEWPRTGIKKLKP